MFSEWTKISHKNTIKTVKQSTTSLYQCLEVIIMYERLKRLYDEGRITQTQLRNAIDKGWITTEEYAEIVG